jgi:hypothetical protein
MSVEAWSKIKNVSVLQEALLSAAEFASLLYFLQASVTRLDGACRVTATVTGKRR